MANYNSKASQILNWTANFLNGVANAGKDLIVNPVVDLWALAAKWVNIGLDKLTGENLAPEANKKIDKAADQITWRADMDWLIKNTSNPVDPTSTAYALWEWLTRWVDQAAAVLTLTEAARQLPKAMQAWWKKILNKVKDAKSKSDQMKLAKEAREYLNKAMDEDLRPKVESAAPAYQQRAVAEHYNDRNLWTKMDKYVNDKYTYNNAEFKNMTSKMNAANLSKDPEAVKMRTARNTVYPSNVDYFATNNNKTYRPLSKEAARDIDVPYKWINKDYYNNVKKEIDDLAKMSDKDFKELMQSKSSASWAWYGDWRYDLWDDRINNWNKPKEYQRMKSQVIENILNDAWLAYWKPGVYWDAIKSNAIKSNKRYRNWIKKDMKNRYDEATKWITREEARAVEQEAANEAADIAAEEAAYKHEGNPEFRF